MSHSGSGVALPRGLAQPADINDIDCLPEGTKPTRFRPFPRQVSTPSPGKLPRLNRRPSAFASAVRNAVEKAKYRSIERGWAFELTTSWMMDQLEAQQYRCALSRVPFRPRPPKGLTWIKDPYAPSLDRIDNSRGYTPDNVRVVLCAVNYALNEWGEGVLFTIAAGLRRKSRSAKGAVPCAHGGSVRFGRIQNGGA